MEDQEAEDEEIGPDDRTKVLVALLHLFRLDFVVVFVVVVGSHWPQDPPISGVNKLVPKRTNQTKQGLFFCVFLSNVVTAPFFLSLFLSLSHFYGPRIILFIIRLVG